jgi:hypothetical protein
MFERITLWTGGPGPHVREDNVVLGPFSFNFSCQQIVIICYNFWWWGYLGGAKGQDGVGPSLRFVRLFMIEGSNYSSDGVSL